MAEASIIVELSGRRLTDGADSSIIIGGSVRGPVQRSIGLAGDAVTVVVRKDRWDAMLADEAEAWDRTLDMDLTFGFDDSGANGGGGTITLEGYRMLDATPSAYGAEEDDPDGPVVAHEMVITLMPTPALLRDGRGGMLMAQPDLGYAGVFNDLGADNLVDTADDSYRTNQELADLCLDAIGLDHDAAPASLDLAPDGETTMVAPGPLDWGNARAIDELDALLAKLGHVAIWTNQGAHVKIIKLKRAGEGVIADLPALITDNLADVDSAADALTYTRGLRAKRIAITSGATRSTIITTRTDLGVTPDSENRPLEWVALDERTGDWLNQAEWSFIYPGEIGPDDIDEWQDGPTGDGSDPTRTKSWSRLYRAVRLADTNDRAQFGAFVALAEPMSITVGTDTFTFARVPAAATARFSIAQPSGKFGNVPTGLSGHTDRLPIAVDQAVPGGTGGTGRSGGVLVLQQDLTYVRVSDVPPALFAYSEAEALASDDLVVCFACQAKTGLHRWDYYRSVWDLDVDEEAGTINGATRVTDEDDVDDAMADPLVVKTNCPWLRRVLQWDDPDVGDPTPLNDSDLHDQAEQVALARGGDDLVLQGVLELRGFRNVQPGDAAGAVTMVRWDLERARTIVSINTHEVMGLTYDNLEALAGRFVASGVAAQASAKTSVGYVTERASAKGAA